MSRTYSCGWCDQTIRKGMCCGAIWDPSSCFWPKRVAEVGVKEALREARLRLPKKGQNISNKAVQS